METKFLATSRDVWLNTEYHKWVTIDSEQPKRKIRTFQSVTQIAE